MTMLIRLDLSYNNITTLPPNISELTKLENLWLSNNPLKLVPPELHLCRKLKVLDLRNTLVESIPREIGRMKNLFSISLEGSPISDECRPFSGNTEDLIAYLDTKDKRTTLAISMENDLLANLYLETADMLEGTLMVKALVKAVCAQFPELGELKNVVRNADRLFPTRYTSPVELRRIFCQSVAKSSWRKTAEKLAIREAIKLKESYIKLTRENEMVKKSADMELKISAIYYDNHDPADIEGWLKSIYKEFKPQNYLDEGRTDCPDLEDISFVIQFATRIFPENPDDITGKLIRQNMLDLQKKLTAEREKCVKSIINSITALYSDREPHQVEGLGRKVGKLFERDRFATEKELEDLKKVNADAQLLFPAEFSAADPVAIKRLFRQRAAAAAAQMAGSSRLMSGI